MSPFTRSSSLGVAVSTVGDASVRSVGTVSSDSAKLSDDPATSGAYASKSRAVACARGSSE